MTNVQLTPIGTSPAWYNAGEASTGFLLEADGFRLLIDCGGGVVARYLELFGAETPLDAVIITHVHADHASDLVPLTYGIEYGQLAHWKPQLWLPPGAHDRLLRLVSAWDADETFFTATHDVHHYPLDETFEIGPISVRALEVPHFIESHALRFEVDGASCGYTADLGPFEPVGTFFNGVDVLVSEATLAEHHDEPAHARGHLTAAEAGEIAAAAQAHSLLLTHVPAHLQAGVVARAAATYDGPIALAQSGAKYPITHRLARAI